MAFLSPQPEMRIYRIEAQCMDIRVLIGGVLEPSLSPHAGQDPSAFVQLNCIWSPSVEDDLGAGQRMAQAAPP